MVIAWALAADLRPVGHGDVIDESRARAVEHQRDDLLPAAVRTREAVEGDVADDQPVVGAKPGLGGAVPGALVEADPGERTVSRLQELHDRRGDAASQDEPGRAVAGADEGDVRESPRRDPSGQRVLALRDRDPDAVREVPVDHLVERVRVRIVTEVIDQVVLGSEVERLEGRRWGEVVSLEVASNVLW
jgi:hypothetical protein